MKRLRTVVHLVALLILGVTPVSAQVALRIRAGASASEFAVNGLEIDAQESRRGIRLGISVAVPLTSAVGVVVGADYLERGSTATPLQLGDVEHRIKDAASVAGRSPPTWYDRRALPVGIRHPDLLARLAIHPDPVYPSESPLALDLLDLHPPRLDLGHHLGRPPDPG